MMRDFLRILALLIIFAGQSFAKDITVTIDIKDQETGDLIPCRYYICEDVPPEKYKPSMRIFGDAPTGVIKVVLPDSARSKRYELGVRSGKIDFQNGKPFVVLDGKYQGDVIQFKIPDNQKGVLELKPLKLYCKNNKIEIKEALAENVKVKELQEVTVTSTKVKFYHKGDTIVYDASAFVLSEGSMLDALLKQMPGMEIKPGGEILCNGRKVQNLLINGKDVFNNNRELMLQNLPAYAIKNVQFYDKDGRMSELMKFNTGDRMFVMDVKLKKKYAQGLILNTEAGYGTENRYLAKLFSLWFGENASVSAYGGANNLSDESVPSQNDNAWKPDINKLSRLEKQQGGMAYNVSGREWELRGDSRVSHLASDKTSQINSLYISPLQKQYAYSWNTFTSNELMAETSHKFYTKIGSVANLEISPYANYNSSIGRSDIKNASFRNEMKNISSNQLSELFDIESALSDSLINSKIAEEEQHDKRKQGGISLLSNIRLPSRNNPRSIQIKAKLDISDNSSEYFDRYFIKYGARKDMNNSQHRYQNNAPNKSQGLTASAQFKQYIGTHNDKSLALTYTFSECSEDNTYDMYTLARDIAYNPNIGGVTTLPAIGLEGMLNQDLSYAYNQSSLNNQLEALFSWNIKDYTLRLTGLMQMSNRVLNYNHFDIEKREDREYRKDILPGGHLFIQKGSGLGNVWTKTFHLNYSVMPVSMLNLVDLPSRNPLSVSLGNSDLRNSSALNVNFGVFRNYGRASHNFDVSYNHRYNAISYSIDMDPTTGVISNRPYNINGNYDCRLSYNLNFAIDENRKFHLESRNTISVKRENSYFMEDMDIYGLTEFIRLNWQPSSSQSYSIFANTNLSRYQYVDSKNGGIQQMRIAKNISSLTKIGLEGIIHLPYSWDLSSDMAVYLRRGYDYAQFNTTDIIWNARISKPFCKGALVFIADARDLLNQMKNVTLTVTPQSRIETITNAIPSFILFHLQWRFNKNPKR